MSQLARLAETLDLITFDCYGTLIDWEQGIRGCMTELGAPANLLRTLVDAYVRTEAAVEQQPYRPYREIQAMTLELLARDFVLPLNHDRRHVLSEHLPSWRPFADTNAALARLAKRFRLGILSNIDRDLLSATRRHFSVEFDLVVTAEDVQSYKPAHPHFLRMIQQVSDRGRVLHVAQSLYHDGVPAGELGLHYVWINRYHGKSSKGVSMLAEFADLESFAGALEV